MLYSSIALAVLTVFTFMTRAVATTSTLVYAYGSYHGVGVLYSFTNIPYGSLARETQNPVQRAQLARSARRLGHRPAHHGRDLHAVALASAITGRPSPSPRHHGPSSV